MAMTSRLESFEQLDCSMMKSLVVSDFVYVVFRRRGAKTEKIVRRI